MQNLRETNRKLKIRFIRFFDAIDLLDSDFNKELNEINYKFHTAKTLYFSLKIYRLYSVEKLSYEQVTSLNPKYYTNLKLRYNQLRFVKIKLEELLEKLKDKG